MVACIVGFETKGEFVVSDIYVFRGSVVPYDHTDKNRDDDTCYY
jgi:hypothetical protein